ncbi:hypothetical protein ACFVV7_33695 [Streptomyces globisporus]|uniref:hypothetical protein n=1 Tax=Streptomyces globisporus TaxID=1908 RepID=UPI0036D9656F
MSARYELLHLIGSDDAESQTAVDRYRAEVLAEAADRIERRAAQLDAVWLRADQVIEALRRLDDPSKEARHG